MWRNMITKRGASVPLKPRGSVDKCKMGGWKAGRPPHTMRNIIKTFTVYLLGISSNNITLTRHILITHTHTSTSTNNIFTVPPRLHHNLEWAGSSSRRSRRSLLLVEVVLSLGSWAG